MSIGSGTEGEKIGYRFEMPGRKKCWMKSEPGTEAFIREHSALIAGIEPVQTERARAYAPLSAGSFSWLVREYARSVDWSELAERTQRQRTFFYRQIEDQGGDLPAADATSAEIRRWRDARLETPAQAKNMMRALSALYERAVEAEHVPTNPVRGVRRPKLSKTGFVPWSVEDIHRFLARYQFGTKQQLALSLLMFTACRREDVVQLGRQNVRSGWMVWTQGKTDQLVEVPVLPPLRDAIEPRNGHMLFLMTEYGKPHTVTGFGTWWSKTVKAAGIAAAPAHGIRKAAGGLLGEFGFTELEIMAVLGHSDQSTSSIYTRSARRRTLAESAMRKMESFKW